MHSTRKKNQNVYNLSIPLLSFLLYYEYCNCSYDLILYCYSWILLTLIWTKDYITWWNYYLYFSLLHILFYVQSKVKCIFLIAAYTFIHNIIVRCLYFIENKIWKKTMHINIEEHGFWMGIFFIKWKRNITIERQKIMTSSWLCGFFF